MTPTPYPIVDVDFITVIDDLDVGWAVWEVDARLEDGTVIHGQCQGDGLSAFDAESFEPDED